MKARLVSTTVFAALAAAIIAWLAISLAFVLRTQQSASRGDEIVVTLLQTAFPLLVVGTVAALPPALGLALLARRRADSTMFPRVVLLGALVGAVWVPAVLLAFFLGAVPGPVWALALAGVASGAVAGLVIARAKPAAATQAESE